MKMYQLFDPADLCPTLRWEMLLSFLTYEIAEGGQDAVAELLGEIAETWFEADPMATTAERTLFVQRRIKRDGRNGLHQLGLSLVVTDSDAKGGATVVHWKPQCDPKHLETPGGDS